MIWNFVSRELYNGQNPMGVPFFPVEARNPKKLVESQKIWPIGNYIISNAILAAIKYVLTNWALKIHRLDSISRC